MLNFNNILVFSKDPEKLNNFYKKVFQKDPEMSEGGYYGYMVGKGFITFGPHKKIKGPNKSPERMMINFETREVKEEFARIEALGAKVITKPYQMEGMKGWIATFSDPDGNYFQLMTPWEDEMK